MLVGAIGWLAPWKGQRAFIETAHAIAARCPRARFVIVGAVSDPRYQSYENELHALGDRLLGSRLIWAGERTPIQPVLAGLDLVLHCADQEPFGRVLIEAMAMQVPVIAFSGGGPDEIIDHGKTGILVPAAGTNDMAAAAVRLLADPDARQAMGSAARERARLHFDSVANVQQIEQVYDSRLRPMIARYSRNWISSDRAIPFLVFAASFIFYVFNLAPGLLWGDDAKFQLNGYQLLLTADELGHPLCTFW